MISCIFNEPKIYCYVYWVDVSQKHYEIEIQSFFCDVLSFYFPPGFIDLLFSGIASIAITFKLIYMYNVFNCLSKWINYLIKR